MSQHWNESDAYADFSGLEKRCNLGFIVIVAKQSICGNGWSIHCNSYQFKIVLILICIFAEITWSENLYVWYM